MKKFPSFRLIVACLGMASGGCFTGCAAPPLSLPNWGDPGTAAYQQRRANRWDIYAESAPMGGDMDGARPREFSQSNPEPTRARWNFWPFAGQ